MNFVSEDGCARRVRSEMNVQTPQKVNAPSVWDTKEWTEMQDLITAALKPHAEAWDAVAKALTEHHSKYAKRP
jgi:hypothetical protein